MGKPLFKMLYHDHKKEEMLLNLNYGLFLGVLE